MGQCISRAQHVEDEQKIYSEKKDSEFHMLSTWKMKEKYIVQKKKEQCIFSRAQHVKDETKIKKNSASHVLSM